MELSELVKIIKDNGVVGAGGAGFPSYAKLSGNPDYVLLNCAECEPLFRADRQLLHKYAPEIMKALSLVVKLLGAEKGIIAFKHTYTEAIQAANEALPEHPFLETALIGSVYPAGDEVVLIYEVLHRVVPEGRLPMDVGVVVFNVETMYNVYRAVFLSQPVQEKFLTIGGAVKTPMTIRVPIGTSFSKVIAMAGGSTLQDFEVISGGPMTGRLASVNTVVTKTTKGILILPPEHLLVQRRRERMNHNINRIKSVCSQCQMCTDLCPRNLLGHRIEPHRIMRAIGDEVAFDITAYQGAMYCCDCGVCEAYACHQGLSPRNVIMELKRKLRINGMEAKSDLKVNGQRDGRRVPSKRLTARLNLSVYENGAPMLEQILFTDEVEVRLDMHIGMPAVPVVEQGTMVRQGQLIAKAAEGRLSTNIHASINGVVSSVEKTGIRIIGMR